MYIIQNVGVSEIQATGPQSKNSKKSEEECYFSFHEKHALEFRKANASRVMCIVQQEPIGTKEKERL